MRYRLAVFDMDGTVLDTLGDLLDAANYTLDEMGIKGDLSEEDAKLMFGSGVKVALSRAFAIKKGLATGYDLLKIGTEDDDISELLDKEELERAEKIYKPYYSSHNDIKTGEYPGISDLIRRLRNGGMKTAVVSNKPDDSVRALSEKLFSGLFDIYIGEKAGIRRKPAPDMTLQALKELEVSEKDSVYIGDSEIDLETAENSGLDCIAVSWGFRNRKFLEDHGATMIAEDTEELFRLLTTALSL